MKEERGKTREKRQVCVLKMWRVWAWDTFDSRPCDICVCLFLLSYLMSYTYSTVLSSCISITKYYTLVF